MAFFNKVLPLLTEKLLNFSGRPICAQKILEFIFPAGLDLTCLAMFYYPLLTICRTCALIL